MHAHTTHQTAQPQVTLVVFLLRSNIRLRRRMLRVRQLVSERFKCCLCSLTPELQRQSRNQ